MQSISLFIELLRTRPRLLFWAMALIQAALWTLVPTFFYSAPPGELPMVLALGHEFQVGTDYGPPLAFWLAEYAYETAGMAGVYFLSQVCIVATFWAVMALGGAIVGPAQAMLAVMLMGGVAVFSVPTPEFGPAVLAAPLWALMLWHYWSGAQREVWAHWIALGLAAGLLVLTTYAGLILIGLLALYTLTTAFGRAQLRAVGPWLAGIALVAVLFPYLIWLDRTPGIHVLDAAAIVVNLRAWGWLVLALALSHAGLVVLWLLMRGLFFAPRDKPPVITRPALHPAARGYVYFFALAPVLAMGLFALFTRRPENFLAAPLVVLSGLAAVVAAGERIRIVHQYLIGYAWAALVALPPLLVALAIVIQPWILAIDLRVGRPAAEMGRFFGDSFLRRTGQTLAIVGGDQSLASLVALAAPSRPAVYLKSVPDDRRRVTRADIAQKGAVIVWPAVDPSGLPPREIEDEFPGLVPEVPHAFSRRYQGRMPLLRLGWGVIRPRAEDASAAPR